MKKKKSEPGVDIKALKAHLQTQDLIEEDGEEAVRASEALCQVRRMFYGTPFEAIITSVITICDEVSEKAKENG